MTDDDKLKGIMRVSITSGSYAFSKCNRLIKRRQVHSRYRVRCRTRIIWAWCCTWTTMISQEWWHCGWRCRSFSLKLVVYVIMWADLSVTFLMKRLMCPQIFVKVNEHHMQKLHCVRPTEQLEQLQWKIQKKVGDSSRKTPKKTWSSGIVDSSKVGAGKTSGTMDGDVEVMVGSSKVDIGKTSDMLGWSGL